MDFESLTISKGIASAKLNGDYILKVSMIMCDTDMCFDLKLKLKLKKK